jgi:hypothetical protein
VYVTFDNEAFYYLTDPSKQTGEENLVAGGQEGVYSAELCVTLADALVAARTFAESGAMDQSVSWEREEAVELVG